jgi:dienelactone hydrolase
LFGRARNGCARLSQTLQSGRSGSLLPVAHVWSGGFGVVVARVALCVVSFAFWFSALVCGLGGHWSLALVPLGIGSLLALSALLNGRRAQGALIGAVAFGLSYSAVRLLIAREPRGWSVCERSRCTENGPWLARLLPEAASLDAGLVLARWTGIVTPDEARRYGAAFAPLFVGAPDMPNALLLHSAPGSLVALVHEPPGDGKVPALVFIHGFGGLSTAYLTAMDHAGLSRFVIVAPALDTFARWDQAAGAAAIDEAMATLPPRADRSRVLLVGVSNGAIFGARYAPRFHAALLLSGIGRTDGPALHVVTGSEDTRISPAWVREVADDLRRAGVDVDLTIVSGADHALVLTHTDAWVPKAIALLEGP